MKFFYKKTLEAFRKRRARILYEYETLGISEADLARKNKVTRQRMNVILNKARSER